MALKGSVGDCMIKKVFVAKPEDDVLKILKIIATGIDQLPVVDDERKLVGIVTWQDILERVILNERNPREVLIRDVMKTKMTKLSPKDPIRKALSLLAMGRFSLPVVDDRRLVGLLSFMDYLKFYLKTEKGSDFRKSNEGETHVTRGNRIRRYFFMLLTSFVCVY
jgi:CBS-domain-containing membrane protein